MVIRKRTLRAGAILASLAVAIGVSAGESYSSISSSSNPSIASIATKAPIQVGFVSDANGQVADPGVQAGFKAAVAYINEALGGINGHPLKAEICPDDGTPGGATTCANKIVASNPAVVMQGLEIQSPITVPIYASHHVPVIAGWTASSTELTNPDVFAPIPNAAGSEGFDLEIPVYFLHVHTLTDVEINLPQVQNFALFKSAANPLKTLGYKVHVILYPPTTSDLSPYISKAAAVHPQSISFGVPVPLCHSGIAAHYQLASKIPLINSGPCGDPALLSKEGKAADGMYWPSGYYPLNSHNADIVHFVSAWKKYGSGGAPSAREQAGFAVAMDFYNVAKTLTTVTSKTVMQALKSGKRFHGYMGHSWACNHPWKLMPSVCSVYNQVHHWQNGAIQTNGKWYSVSKAYDQAAKK